MLYSWDSCCIRYMTNDSNLGYCKCIRCFNDIFLSILVLVVVKWHFWPICLYFDTYFMEFKMGFDQGFQLMNDVVFSCDEH